MLQAKADRIIPNRELYGYGFDAYLYVENQELLEKEFKEKELAQDMKIHAKMIKKTHQRTRRKLLRR